MANKFFYGVLKAPSHRIVNRALRHWILFLRNYQRGLPQPRKRRQLFEELKAPGLDQNPHDEILDIVLVNFG